MPKEKPFKIPKNLADVADLYYLTRQKRLLEQKKVDEIEDQEKQLKQHIIDNLPKSKIEGIQGKVCRVSIDKKTKPIVEDWDKFYAYVKKNNAFDLMQRRIADKAIEERWADKKAVPGIGKFTAVTLSVNKV